MVLFLFAITEFVGAYGGGFVDYFVSGIISLILFEIFPFLWSIFIALFIYIGSKQKKLNVYKALAISLCLKYYFYYYF